MNGLEIFRTLEPHALRAKQAIDAATDNLGEGTEEGIAMLGGLIAFCVVGWVFMKEVQFFERKDEERKTRRGR